MCIKVKEHNAYGHYYVKGIFMTSECLILISLPELN